MRHRILLVALVFSAIYGGTACSSPPVESKHEVGKLEVKKEHVFTPVEATAFSYTALNPAMYSLDGHVIVEQTSAVKCSEFVTALPTKNCSKPQRIGLANRRRLQERKISVVHLLVAATCGHRLLHIDPGLC